MKRAVLLSLVAAALAGGRDLQKIKAAATQDAHAYAYLEELSNVRISRNLRRWREATR
jgi:hypothetical protein